MVSTGKLRGWIRASQRHSEAMQRRALDAAGCDAIYCAPETVADLVQSLRQPRKGGRGDVVLVTSLARLGRNRDELRRAVADIHKMGAVIVEARDPPRRSDDRDHLAEMLLDAADELAGDKRGPTPDEARERGRKGGRAKGLAAAAERTSLQIALTAWRDLSITGSEALADPRMRGWTVKAAYRHLKHRNTAPGTRTGRPRKET